MFLYFAPYMEDQSGEQFEELCFLAILFELC